MPLTILPGEGIQTDSPAESAPARRRAGLSVSRRTGALALAAVLALGGGGFLLLHKSGPAAHTTAPPAPAAPVKHVPAPAQGKPGAPRTRAEAMRAAVQIFPVLAAQLPGWQVSGKATFESNNSDPVSRSIERCFNGANSGGISVDSPSASQTTSTPTEMNVDATLTFVRSAQVAARDLASIRKPSAQRCIGSAVLNRTVAMGPGATLRFTSMKTLHVPGRTFGMEFDGRVQSNVLGDQSVRVVMLGTIQRATEIMVSSAGFDIALPLSADRRLLTAVAARTAQVLR